MITSTRRGPDRAVSDGVDAPTQRHLRARMVVLEPLHGRASMEKVSIIGLDLAKSIIQVRAGSEKLHNEDKWNFCLTLA